MWQQRRKRRRTHAGLGKKGSGQKGCGTFLHQAGITPRRSIILSNLETASQMAAEGMGIAFNFEQYIRHFSYTKEVRYFRIGNCRSIPYSIVTRKGKYLPVYTKRLIQLFTDSVRQKKAREALSARS